MLLNNIFTCTAIPVKISVYRVFYLCRLLTQGLHSVIKDTEELIFVPDHNMIHTTTQSMGT